MSHEWFHIDPGPERAVEQKNNNARGSKTINAADKQNDMYKLTRDCEWAPAVISVSS